MPRSSSRLFACLGGLIAFAALPRPAAAFTAAEAKMPMTVTLVRGDAGDCGADCPEWLAMTGKIGFETPRLLAAALARLNGRKVPVLLDSPGGESLAGIGMGRMIRAHKLETVVGGTVLSSCDAGDLACASRLRAGLHPGHVGTAIPACASACVLVLAGGADRAVPYGAYVGVHQAMQVLTYHPVMNTFRILRRTVNGRTTEVSRTLVATRALPTRVVKSAAPQSIYSAFDRYLLEMGIDGSIMPLMRATLPSGIHWMTRQELDSTRIATDTTEAAALVAREAASRAAADAAAAARRSAEAAAAALRPVQAPAALTLNDDRRWTGVITWRIDATSRDVPVLVGDWHLPERHLKGSVEIVPETAPGAAWSFTVTTRFTAEAKPEAATILAFRAPRICDASLCMGELSESAIQDRPVATFHVVRNWRGDFLLQLHKRDWLIVDVGTDDGWGQVALTLSSLDNHAIDLWEKLCCGFAAIGDPWTSPATLLPGWPTTHQPFLVSGLGPVTPVAGGPPPTTPHRLDVTALLDARSTPGDPARVHGSMTWTPLAILGRSGQPGDAVLLGEVDLPAAGLHLKVQIGRSDVGVLGRLTLDIHATAEEQTLFGPPGRLTVMSIYDRQRHPLLLADSVVGLRWEGGYRAAVDIPETGPIAGALQLAFDDAEQRRVTLALPFDPATAALLQTAARGDDPGGS